MKKDYEERLKVLKEDYEEKIKDQKEDLHELKGHITWLWRAFVTSFVTFIFSLILLFINKTH